MLGMLSETLCPDSAVEGKWTGGSTVSSFASWIEWRPGALRFKGDETRSIEGDGLRIWRMAK